MVLLLELEHRDDLLEGLVDTNTQRSSNSVKTDTELETSYALQESAPHSEGLETRRLRGAENRDFRLGSLRRTLGTVLYCTNKGIYVSI
jgi:hypothetical protein